jgi:hypothetical protein
MKLKVAILALLAWSPLLLAQDAADSSADAAAEGPRTGDFSNWSLDDELACGNELSLDRQRRSCWRRRWLLLRACVLRRTLPAGSGIG